VIVDSSDHKSHLGVDFVIWRRESAWFWLLMNPLGSGGVIGAAINEARAIREACLSIEALLTVSLM
jgi:hypothetical protein